MNQTVRVWSLVFGIFQVAVMVVGGAMLAAGIALYASEPQTVLLPQDALVSAIVGSAALALVAVTAFIVVCLRKRTDGASGARLRWLVIDSVAMAILAAALVLAALLTVHQVGDLNGGVKKHFSQYWDTASPAFIALLQSQGECCGFGGYGDRVLEPCKKYAEAVGCWTVIRDEHAYYLHLLLPGLFGLGALAAAGALLAVIMIVVRVRTTRKGGDNATDDEFFQINRSQPFDAWHKAVFS